MSASVRSGRVGAGRVIFSVISAVVFSALVCLTGGCSGGDTAGSGGGGGNLVLGANEAWTATVEGETMGFIFEQDKDFIMIVYMEEEEYGVEGWFGYVAGTWSTSGNSITLTFNYGETVSGVYTISGNTATIDIEGDAITFKKTGGITYTDISALMKSNATAKLPKLFFKKTL